MEQQLLSKKEAAEVLGISTSTLDRRVREGLIPTIKGHKTPKFNINDIMKVSGTEIDRLSAFERKKLEKEIVDLRQEIERLQNENRGIKRQVANMVADLAPILKEA